MEHDDQNSPRPFTLAFPADNSFDGISFDAAGTYQGDASASPTTMTQPPVLPSPTPQTPQTSPSQPLTPQASPTVSAQQSTMTQMPIIPIIAPYPQSAAQQPPVQQTPLAPASQQPLQSSASSAQQRTQPMSPANPQSPADPYAGHARQARQPLPPIAPYKGRKAAWYWEKAPDDNYTNPNYHKIFDWSCFGRILLVTVVITAVMYVLYLAYYCGMLMLFRGRSIQEIYSSQLPEVTTDGLDYLFFLLGLINILIAAPICQAVGMRGRHPSKVTYWRDRPGIEPMVAAWGFGKRTYLGSGIASLIDKGAVGVDSQGHIYLRGTPSRPLTPREIKLMGFLAVAFGDFYREHPDFAGAPDGSGARVNPSVAELTDHLSRNGLKALSDVQSETSKVSNTIMYSMGTPRIFMLLGCAFVSGVFSMFAGTSIFTEAGGCASLTQILIRYEGFTWLGIMAPIANLLSVVYAVAAAAVLIINQRRLQSIRTTASDGKRQIDILRIFLVVYCLITLTLSPVRAVGMVLAWYLLIDAKIPTNRINLPMMRLYHHVLGLGKYLKDYSDLGERGTTRDAQLYGWNLAYAVALGLSKGELASVDRVVWKLSGSTAQSEPVGRHASASSKEPDPFDNLRRLGIPINIKTEELNHKIDNVVVQTAEKHGIKAAAYNSDREAYAALVSDATEPRPDDNMAQKSVRAYVRWLNEELEKRDHDES
ncbi:MAG: hypothetical protein SOH72_01200 [Bifidobacterium thermacidophilum]|jgi:hypothetical protein|uniref:DUF2207 family protein n=1 Tax=Bifidobacterium thermacidophilum TaxID=246618 RepID=UPI002F36083F